MSSSEFNFQVVYRGETMDHIIEGGWVFFQRAKVYGGGYWLGRTYNDVFLFDPAYPVSLSQGMNYLILTKRVEESSNEFVDMNYTLF